MRIIPSVRTFGLSLMFLACRRGFRTKAAIDYVQIYSVSYLERKDLEQTLVFAQRFDFRRKIGFINGAKSQP